MVREIKFRGKRKDNNEWVCGSLVCIDKTYIFNKTKYYEIFRETAGQKLHPKDYDNKDVYEGNIYTLKESNHAISKKAPFVCQYNTELEEFELRSMISKGFQLSISFLKVLVCIGNIYDDIGVKN